MSSVKKVVRFELLLNLGDIVILKIPSKDWRLFGYLVILLRKVFDRSRHIFTGKELLNFWVIQDSVVGFAEVRLMKFVELVLNRRKCLIVAAAKYILYNRV